MRTVLLVLVPAVPWLLSQAGEWLWPAGAAQVLVLLACAAYAAAASAAMSLYVRRRGGAAAWLSLTACLVSAGFFGALWLAAREGL